MWQNRLLAAYSAAAQGTLGRSAHSNLVHSLFVKSSNTSRHLQHTRILAERGAYFLPLRTIYLARAQTPVPRPDLPRPHRTGVRPRTFHSVTARYFARH
jgi:hypothetical protein